MVEFRLYYDDNGKVICYTCEKLPGENFLIIDSDTYHRCNPHLYVIDGELVDISQMTIIQKLKPSKSGVTCDYTDVCMISDTGTTWNLTTHEKRNY